MPTTVRTSRARLRARLRAVRPAQAGVTRWGASSQPARARLSQRRTTTKLGRARVRARRLRLRTSRARVRATLSLRQGSQARLRTRQSLGLHARARLQARSTASLASQGRLTLARGVSFGLARLGLAYYGGLGWDLRPRLALQVSQARVKGWARLPMFSHARLLMGNTMLALARVQGSFPSTLASSTRVVAQKGHVQAAQAGILPECPVVELAPGLIVKLEARIILPKGGVHG